MNKKASFTTEIFVEKAKAIYGDLYDYSKVNYKGCTEEVEIICSKHGPFWKIASNHLHYKQGCPVCSMGTRRKKKKKLHEEIPPIDEDDTLREIKKKYNESVPEAISAKSTLCYFKSPEVGIIILTVYKTNHQCWNMFFLAEELPSVIEFVLEGVLDGRWTSTNVFLSSHWTTKAFDKIMEYTNKKYSIK